LTEWQPETEKLFVLYLKLEYNCELHVKRKPAVLLELEDQKTSPLFQVTQCSSCHYAYATLLLIPGIE